MTTRQVTTQAELDQALADGVHDIDLVGDGYFDVTASDSATVHAYGSATVRAYGSATVHASGSATVHASGSAMVHASGSAMVHASGSATVHAYDSATVHAYDSATVHAYDSATVRASGSATVHAYDSATVHAFGSATVHAFGSAMVRAFGSATVHAFGSATVHASGSATVHASDLVAVQDHGPKTKVAGGVVIPIRTPETMTDWCSYYGVTVARGWATVYKAVQNDLTSVYGFAYPIGTEVACTDWSDTKACGQGLHFSPRPWMALKYADGPRFLAVKVKVAECVVLDDKIKAPRCKVIGEVDEDGEPVG